MATPTPTQHAPLTPEERLALEQRDKYERITRNLAIGGVIVCPLIALMPPRKLDLYTLSLGIGFYLSADHLATQYNGRGLIHQFSFSSAVRELPTDRAVEVSRILQEKKEREELERAKQALREGTTGGQENRSVMQRIWMGDEKEDWKEKRMEEERKMLEQGKGYGSMIMDQIWEVWNWDKKKEVDKRDEPKKE